MFHWICPECGREIPPAVTECPGCDPQREPAETPAALVAEAIAAAISAAPPVTEPVGAPVLSSVPPPAALVEPPAEIFDPLMALAERIRSVQIAAQTPAAPQPE